MTENREFSSNSDRLEYLYLNLVGQIVQVHTVDGAVTEGIFASRSDADKEADQAGILLNCTRRCASKVHNALDSSEFAQGVMIPYRLIVYIEANKVNFRTEAPGFGHTGQFTGMRALVNSSWADLSKEEMLESTPHVPGEWNQFEDNKRRFNLRSTYSEDLYTTTLDKSKVTTEQWNDAERIARDIESSASRGIHHRIERGEMIDEQEMDEGALHSDVARGDPRKKAAYVPPGVRKPGEPAPPAAVEASAPHAAPASATTAAPANTTAATTAMAPAGTAATNSSGAGARAASNATGVAVNVKSPPPVVAVVATGPTAPASSGLPVTSGAGGVVSTAGVATGQTTAAAGGDVTGVTPLESLDRKTDSRFNPAAAPFTPNAVQANGFVGQNIGSKVFRDFMNIVAAAIERNPRGFSTMPDWPGNGKPYDKDDSNYTRQVWAGGQATKPQVPMNPSMGSHNMMYDQVPMPGSMPMQQPAHMYEHAHGQGPMSMQMQRQHMDPMPMHGVMPIPPQRGPLDSVPMHGMMPNAGGYGGGGGSMMGGGYYGGRQQNPPHQHQHHQHQQPHQHQHHQQQQQQPQQHPHHQQPHQHQQMPPPPQQPQPPQAHQPPMPHQHQSPHGPPMQHQLQQPPPPHQQQPPMPHQHQHQQQPPMPHQSHQQQQPMPHQHQHHQQQQQQQPQHQHHQHQHQQLPHPGQPQHQHQYVQGGMHGAQVGGGGYGLPPQQVSMNPMGTPSPNPNVMPANTFPDQMIQTKMPSMRQGQSTKTSAQPQQPVSAAVPPAPVAAVDGGAPSQPPEVKSQPKLTRGRGGGAMQSRGGTSGQTSGESAGNSEAMVISSGGGGGGGGAKRRGR